MVKNKSGIRLVEKIMVALCLCILLLVGCTGTESETRDIVSSGAVGVQKDNEQDKPKGSIQYDLSADGTLTFSGEGVLSSIDTSSLTWEERGTVKKVIIQEGVTVVQGNAVSFFDYMESIALPDSVTKLGDGCLKSCSSLKTITFGKNVTEIGRSAFSGCHALENLEIPDTVVKIGSYAFYDCKRLQKLVLPSSLKKWKKNTTEKCPRLREIVNRSNIQCKIDDCKGLRIWSVDGREISAIPKGKTALARGKMIPITYKLQGGKKIGKLPNAYEYGTRLKIPLNVARKGYTPIAWSWHGKTSYADMTFYVGPNAKEVTLIPSWFKYKIKNIGEGAVRVRLEKAEGDWYYSRYDIRYSRFHDMSDSQMVTLDTTESDVIEIDGLEKGATYYFQFRAYPDADSAAGDWVGKRKVGIAGG